MLFLRHARKAISKFYEKIKVELKYKLMMVYNSEIRYMDDIVQLAENE